MSRAGYAPLLGERRETITPRLGLGSPCSLPGAPLTSVPSAFPYGWRTTVSRRCSGTGIPGQRPGARLLPGPFPCLRASAPGERPDPTWRHDNAVRATPGAKGPSRSSASSQRKRSAPPPLFGGCGSYELMKKPMSRSTSMLGRTSAPSGGAARSPSNGVTRVSCSHRARTDGGRRSAVMTHDARAVAPAPRNRGAPPLRPSQRGCFTS